MAEGSKQKETKAKEHNAEQQAQQGKKKRKEIFPYGNYKNYYGYRLGQDLEEDPRLKVMKKEWFEGKDCLDIGCNNGVITIQIAKKFGCRSILGVDIDSNRIEDAHWHLRKIVRMEKTKKIEGKVSRSEVSEDANGIGNTTSASLDEETKHISRNNFLDERNLFDIVKFQQENFVWSQKLHEKHYDTIVCLSVTKWIHLNWGDDGLITLFSKIWRLLNPGGILVLEPQPWKSYESNRQVSETTLQNYKKIMFRPECFQDLLLDKIGFRTVEDVTASVSGSKIGFNRPILVFRK
ncbi:hypothetical protein UlMin_022218 [Ulmus minor]